MDSVVFRPSTADDVDDSELLKESVQQEAMLKQQRLMYMQSHPSQFGLAGIHGLDEDDEVLGDGEEVQEAVVSPKKAPHVKALFQVGDIPTYLSAQDMKFQRVRIDELDDEAVDHDALAGAQKLLRALELHDEWTSADVRSDYGPRVAPTSPKSARDYRREVPIYDPMSVADDAPLIDKWDVEVVAADGILRVENNEPVRTLREFASAFTELEAIVNAGPVKSLSYARLAVLEELFNLHVLLNGQRELSMQKKVPHRDFYNIRKVDTHVHHSACMNQKHLLRFIKAKLRKRGQEVVTMRDGVELTLEGVFKSLRLTAYDLSIDTLDMHAHDTFHRFDRFNLKYNPAGQSRLREIFLKTDNYVKGRYLAEITKEVIADLEASKYQFAEWRVSIYGRRRDEWQKLADWFFENELASPNVRWMIQVPRLYSVYKQSGLVESFGDLLANIFEPLFKVTLDPASNPKLHAFLEAIVGFDSVDDESKADVGGHLDPNDLPPTPPRWTSDAEPSYPYWMFYLHANLRSLNALRRERQFSTFEFRPHCGEAGDVSHLVAAYLTTRKINHGVQLRRSPGMQYLYYLSRIGIAMSPLSNNRLFLDFNKNPFHKYFKRGLNVSLSTDDPLMLHFTKDPLVEEYSVAAQIWKLSSTDVCEVARNSVLQSGIEDRYKRHYIGENYDKPGAEGNDIRMTNVPDVRVTYRHENWQREIDFIKNTASKQPTPPAPSRQPSPQHHQRTSPWS
ncbi:hypothetical protein CTAYLR_001957 [Chrysophaeum taylorii]|uniref:AMP deaminase n=1 Tax=Chrysophaeum taylorii TaxID=2483200 RepID=A0AAD7U8H4_9STRA|nr:hypothetical protein CTAYLR_001957 [Chrysophaeum taylorii]